VGTSKGGTLPHVYGAGWGMVAYRFALPARVNGQAWKRVRIGARVSSEWPGFSPPANVPAAEAGSRVEVYIDGERVGQLDAPPDDGAGQWREVTIRSQALRGRLGAGVHTLAFVLPERPTSHGLCIYAAAIKRGDGQMDKVDKAEPPGESGPIRLTFEGEGAGE
jgi:hypothetical protein